MVLIISCKGVEKSQLQRSIITIGLLYGVLVVKFSCGLFKLKSYKKCVFSGFYVLIDVFYYIDHFIVALVMW